MMTLTATLRGAAAATLILLAGCEPAATGAAPAGPAATDAVSAPPAAPAPAPATATASDGGTGNLIRMRVDGVEWAADREIFCMVDPPGMGPVVIVSGSRGPKDANEQTFNLNLTGVTAPGPLQLKGGGSVTHVIQLANLDAERYLNGGAFGFDVNLDVVALSRSPAHIEARFNGTLNSSAGAPLRIEDGHVRCTE
jgi:hypothetical protein